MNVLFMVSWYHSIADVNPNGGFHYRQAKALSKECNIAIYYPYERNLDRPFVVNEEMGLLTYRSQYKLEKKIRNRINMYRTMKRIVKEFQPDLIHAQVATEAGRFAVVLGKLFNIPVMITEHSSVDVSGVREFPHYYYAKYAYGGSKFNASVSDANTEGLRKLFPKYKFETIYNGISVSDTIVKKTDYRKSNVVNAIIVAAMYDKSIKGIPQLLRVIKKFVDEGEGIHLHLIGGGEYYDYFVEYARELGVYDSCTFYGRCPSNRVYEIVSQMDFLISASKFESFGCTMAEAAMLGVPVLATNSGGSASIVTKTVGILINNNSEEELYSGIRQMLEAYSKFSHENMIREARNKFDMELITKRYLDIYKSILDASKNR